MARSEQLAGLRQFLSRDSGNRIVTVNGGSSTLKIAVFEGGIADRCLLRGSVDRIEGAEAQLSIAGDGLPKLAPIGLGKPAELGHEVAGLLKSLLGDATTGLGHRVVHGGLNCLEHQQVTPEMVAKLRQAIPVDRAHLPREIALIEAFGETFGRVPQVACFDTAFHREMPRVAQMLAIPQRYDESGMRRFGFHGLSYSYLARELRRIAGPEVADGKVIFAHLGSGASMAATDRGRPVETTMGFTPLAGLVMGTRPGDLDPGVITYLMENEGRTPAQMEEFLNKECGLIGVSGTSSDMRDLMARRASDARAADAVELFCYQARKAIGALAAALGGVETLVFSAGIGEHVPYARAKICGGLEFLGIRMDDALNETGEAVISANNSAVTVRIMATDEESIIARIVCDVLALHH